jgi:hypothetical protein
MHSKNSSEKGNHSGGGVDLTIILKVNIRRTGCQRKYWIKMVLGKTQFGFREHHYESRFRNVGVRRPHL